MTPTLEDDWRLLVLSGPQHQIPNTFIYISQSRQIHFLYGIGVSYVHVYVRDLGRLCLPSESRVGALLKTSKTKCATLEELSPGLSTPEKSRKRNFIFTPVNFHSRRRREREKMELLKTMNHPYFKETTEINRQFSSLINVSSNRTRRSSPIGA